MNSTTETIRDKIRKLLRVVECDSASEAEKSAALYQASRLSQKHAIDLDALGGEASDFGSTKLADFGQRSPSWCLAVTIVLANHFNVRCFVSRTPSPRGGRDVSWYCFGCAPSRQIAVYVWTYLRLEFCEPIAI
ncbi:MAG: DUF2786 domain-containing protein [Flavobacteriales bacterium]|nr:DUF2786 domain-containing protein [Flavobacteriales bacterium]